MNDVFWKWLIEVYEREDAAITIEGCLVFPRIAHLAERTKYDWVRSAIKQFCNDGRLFKSGQSWFYNQQQGV